MIFNPGAVVNLCGSFLLGFYDYSSVLIYVFVGGCSCVGRHSAGGMLIRAYGGIRLAKSSAIRTNTIIPVNRTEIACLGVNCIKVSVNRGTVTENRKQYHNRIRYQCAQENPVNKATDYSYTKSY